MKRQTTLEIELPSYSSLFLWREWPCLVDRVLSCRGVGKGEWSVCLWQFTRGPFFVEVYDSMDPFWFFSCPNCFSHCLEYVLCFSGIVVMFWYLRNSTFFGLEFACVVSIPLVKCLTKEVHPWNIDSPFCYNVIVSDLTVCD